MHGLACEVASAACSDASSSFDKESRTPENANSRSKQNEFVQNKQNLRCLQLGASVAQELHGTTHLEQQAQTVPFSLAALASLGTLCQRWESGVT